METDKSLLLNVLDDEDNQLIIRIKRKRLNEYYGLRVRSHFYVLFGFVFGFLMAYATILYCDRQLLVNTHFEHQTTNAVNYKLDPTFKSRTELMHTNQSLAQLMQEIRILCVVLTCPKYYQSRARHVYATWGSRCSKLVFISSEDDNELGAIKVVDTDDYTDLWNKTREGFRYIYNKYFNEYDWFLKADDDTYVIMENLRYMLYAYSTDMPIYFGYEMIRYDVNYMSGGASYVLSKAALSRFVEQAFHNDTLCPHAQRYGAEDFYMGICLQNVGVRLADSRLAIANDSKTKFYPLDLMAYMHPEVNTTIPDWLYEMTPYDVETGLSGCSNYSIAFHYTNPQQMYLYEFFLYNLRVFGRTQVFAEQLPSIITLEEVDKLYVKNQSNGIVNIDPVTVPDNF